MLRIEPVTTVEVQHVCGSWKIMTYPALTEAQFLALAHGRVQATSSWVSFKTPGLAVGWVKRLAKSSPDSSSEFHVLPWDGKYSIYFG
jgi:hypothetical protein